MEVLVGASVIGLGYLFTKNGIDRNKLSFASEIEDNQKPNGINILDSKRSYNIWQDEQKKAQKLFEKTKDPAKTNVVIPGPPFKKIKVDYQDKKLPIVFNNDQKFEQSYLNLNQNNMTGPQMTNNQNQTLNNSTPPFTGGWSGIQDGGPAVPNDLFAERKNDSNFQHNNMVPFFGGHVRQNVDQLANTSILENFTGNIDNYRKKKEVGTFFKPSRNMSNVYGMQNYDSSILDRFQTSRVRNNEAPIEPIRVGPGLNKGYTWKPSGGIQQNNTRDYVMPKTTDELRVLNNPKVTYRGRIIPGQHISKPGKVGTVQKNLPDTFYIQQPDRYFTTTGQTIAQAEYPEFIVKHTNRVTTEQKKRIGAAAPVHGTVENIRSKVKRSSKLTLDTSEPRNATIAGQWSINKNNQPNGAVQNRNTPTIPNDYGRSGLTNKPNARMQTQLKSVVLNKKSPIDGGEYRNYQSPRRTRKTNVIGNPRWASNVQAPHNRHKVYDPNDVPKTTIKETNIYNNNMGNMGIQAPSRQPVYDPNDVPRTTIKETNIHDNNGGYMSIQAPSRQPVYDPNDVPRTTIKETNIHDNNGGYMSIQAPARQPVYDPNDVPRTTIKETNIHNNNMGNMGIQAPSRQPVYDPNDVPRTTIKETNIHNNNTGNMGIQAPSRPRVYDPNDLPKTTIKEMSIDNGRNGIVGGRNNLKSVVYDPNNTARVTMKQTSMRENSMGNVGRQDKNYGYINKKIRAPKTHRQTYTTSYTGNMDGPNEGGYQIANADPRLTKRQFLSDHEYVGNAGATTQQKPMSYSDVYNATISTLKTPVEGRVPGPEGNKGTLGPADINMTTTRRGDHTNAQLSQRGVQPSRIYNSIPQNILCGETKGKETVPNEPLADRLDPRMVDQFRKNPYTQSLSSYVFP